MEHTAPQLISTAELAPVHRSGPTPFSQQTVVLTKQASLALTWEANSWRAQHARLVEREAALKGDVEALQGTIRDLTQRLSGATSEQSACPDRPGASPLASPRQRGQQPGSTGHGRSDRPALPVVTAVHDVSEAAQHGPAGGKACAPCPGAASSDVIAIQVQAHMRRLQRPRSHKTCPCPQVPGMVTAPPAPRVLPQSPLGVSVWTRVLLDTYLYGRPTHRVWEEWQPHGVPLAHGTLTEGLQRLAVLCEPVMRALSERQRGAQLFQGDATRWAVCAEVAGTTGQRWSLWVRQSASVVCYRMAPGRGADGPTAHGATRRKDLVDVVLVGDRYRASPCLAKAHDQLMVASCWAPGRRDVFKAARRWPALERWLCAWVNDMRALSRLTKARLEGWEATGPRDQPSAAFPERHGDLETPLRQMPARGEAHRLDPALHRVKTKVLSSLQNHWDGLTVFVERPAVAMDHPTAERTLRNPVVGRKHSDGSGSVWSAHLAAMLGSVVHTVWLWGLHPHHWRSAFLQACAEHGGQSPSDLNAFLPWQMTLERRDERGRPVPVIGPPAACLAQERGEPAGADTS